MIPESKPKATTPIAVAVVDELRSGYPDEHMRKWVKPEDHEAWRAGYLFAVARVCSSCSDLAKEPA